MDKLKIRLYENRKMLFLVVLLGVVLLPMVYTIFYTLPSADDFSMALGCEKDTLLWDSIHHANDRFMNWSGLWPYMFIETLANPLLHFSLESWWGGAEMVLLFLFFVISFITLIDVVFKKVMEIHDKGTIALFTLVTIFVFLNTNIYHEIFYWFVGSCYMMALTLGLLTINLTIRLFFDEKINKGGGTFTLIKRCISL